MSEVNARAGSCLFLAAQVWACAPPAPAPASCFTSLDDDATRNPQQVSWVTVGEPALDAGGVSETIHVAIGTDARWVALRVSDPEGGAACVQLHDVIDPNGAAWVTPPASLEDFRSYCRSCPERVSVGVGSGFFVLPSGDPPPPPATNLSIRAAARDCPTFLAPLPGTVFPGRLRIEALLLPEIEDTREGVLELEVVITEGSVFYDDPAASPAALDAAFAEVNAIFAPAKLRVRPVRVRRVEGEDALAFERGDYTALDRLQAEAHACDPAGAAPDDFWVPLVLAGCLELSDPVQMSASEPNGFVPRIPDGMATPGRARGVFIKGRECSGEGARIEWPPESLAKLVAHELGHYLGLYHAVEPDGGTDTLDDTGEDNLMHWVSPTKTLTAGQIRVMRRHPALRW